MKELVCLTIGHRMQKCNSVTEIELRFEVSNEHPMRCDVGKGDDGLGGECVSEFEEIQSRQFLWPQPDPI